MRKARLLFILIAIAAPCLFSPQARGCYGCTYGACPSPCIYGKIGGPYNSCSDCKAFLCPEPNCIPPEGVTASQNGATCGFQLAALRDDDSRVLSVRTVGIDPTITVNGVRVQNVLLNSPAYIAGIRSGDSILLIDGTPLRHRSYRDVVSALDGPAEVRLVVRRGARSHAVLLRGSPISVVSAQIASPQLRTNDRLLISLSYGPEHANSSPEALP